MYFSILLVPPSPGLGEHAALWFGPFLGSVPHECNLDECSSLAFGLINNNINSNYCDRLINSFKNAAQRKRHKQIFSGDKNFYWIIVDIISNFMFQNTTEIIKNFFFFVLFHILLLFSLFFLAKPALCELSFSDPVSVCSPDKCNPALWGHSFVLWPFWRFPLITKLYLLWNSPPSLGVFCWGKEWSVGPQLSINSICFIGWWLAIIKIRQHKKCIWRGCAQWTMKSLYFLYHTHTSYTDLHQKETFQLSRILGSTNIFHDK